MKESLKERIDKDKLPQHVAIIMDGNGRWAKKQGNQRIFGHMNGVKAVREVVEGSAEIGLKYLTLYAFSTENWNRPGYEVDALMNLLVDTINDETKTLIENNVRLKVIGDIQRLPASVVHHLRIAMESTENNTGLTLILALSYSGRWEILDAIRKIAGKIEKKEIKADDIKCEYFTRHLQTAGFPDPEMLIRTSGERRISNFLLWQMAYTELYFSQTLWPDFTREELFEAICDFQKRERRFGKISEQATTNYKEG